MKRPTLRVLEYRHSQTHPWYLDLRPFNRGRKFFKTKAEAEAERLRQITTLERHGREAVGLPPAELSAIIRARRDLAKYDKTINDAAAFFLDHLERINRCNVTVAKLANEVVEAKRKDGHSPIYIADLKKRLATFSANFGERKIAGITVEELDNWLRNLECGPKSRANFRANVGVMFSYAERRRVIDSNPILRTARPKLIDKAPEIFSVDELADLLNAASTSAPDVIPMLAIGAYAGLREAEIKRLAWAEIDLRRRFIEVKAAKAKTARRRIIGIQPNLRKWLRPYAKRTGPVVPANSRKKLDLVRKAAGLTRWPKNGLRHSFASYRLAATHDAPRVASELGHTSPKMLYSTYRELVLPKEAQRYWKIVPATGADNVIPFEAASKMIQQGIPSCEWPDAKRGATFHNCCDKDGFGDKNLMEIAAKKRIKEIREESSAGSGRTNRKRKGLYHEADRLERMFKLGKYSPVPVGEIDKRKEKATEKNLRWLGKKKDDQANLQE